ncbi:MAG: protein phosphatase CheZ [Thermodesulfobacteriota bacterium]
MSGLNNDNIIHRLREELSRLLEYVEKTKAGLENIENTVMVGSETVPEASLQINAVTGDLETAANTIMTILEEVLAEHDMNHALIADLTEWVGGLPEKERCKGAAIISEIGAINERTKKNMMDIFSNMSFHDLSGQKLKKVTTSLSIVQSKLLEIASSFGIKNVVVQEAGASKGNGSAIANGPMDQDIVDQLLKELGT